MHEVYSTNGVSYAGVSLVVDWNDSKHVTVCVDSAVRGTVVLYARYLSTNQTLVFPNPFVVVERLVGDSMVGVLLKPRDPTLSVGEAVDLTIWGVFDNGMKSQLFVSPESPLMLTSSDESVVAVSSNATARLLLPGAATITANYLGFSSQTTITVLGSVMEPGLSISRDLEGETVLLTLTGSAGRSHTVEASGDLVNWTPMSTNVLSADGVFQFRNPVEPDRAKFYRAILNP